MHSRRPLTIQQVLAWADAFRELKGCWPKLTSGSIVGTIGETWAGIDAAFQFGRRELPQTGSLARFLAEHRGARNIQHLPPLSVEQILVWADAYFNVHGTWPTADSGFIANTPKDRWHHADRALRDGRRGLPGGSSLARVLAEHRGVRNRKALPPLTRELILGWADEHKVRTGKFPHSRSGPIHDAPGETWTAVDVALNHGQRGLPGGSSLALLLAEEREVRNLWVRPTLTIEQVLAWVDDHYRKTAAWPNLESGPVPDAPGETWCAINHALRKGSRGLPGGSSLAKFLAEYRGARTKVAIPQLRRSTLLSWARSHHARTGTWPTKSSGPIHEAPEETWAAVDQALRKGSRGLRGSSSLAHLLAERGLKRNHLEMPPLSNKKILAWADEHHQATGKWPNVNSGMVRVDLTERWDLIDNALRQGHRGLPGGSSLLILLAQRRGVRNPLALPPLSEDQILAWADQHRQRTGQWPKYTSGPIADALGET